VIIYFVQGKICGHEKLITTYMAVKTFT